MFKVSFKETPKNPSKLVTKMGNETTVMLKGICDLPEFWKYLPEEIVEWITHQKHVEGYEDIAKNQLIIYAKGISKCHPEDKYDTVFGERMAESRAKEFIYKFFYDLTSKLYDYYDRIMFGYPGVVAEGNNGSLAQDVAKYEKLLNHEKQHQVELLQDKIHGGEQ